MCQRLVKAGYPVTAFDLNPIVLEKVIAVGAKAAISAAECAAQAEIFLISLPRPDHVETVMAGENGALKGLKSGSLWIDPQTETSLYSGWPRKRRKG
jgi:3-hydroxyisobutyrate dehydrogenase/2-hydroxy-3-oxopropionate reductase